MTWRRTPRVLLVLLLLAGCTVSSAVTNDRAQITQGASAPAALNEALAPHGPEPSLDPGLPRYHPPGPGPVDKCGDSWNYVDVEYFGGKSGIPRSYARAFEQSTVMFQWLSGADIEARLPGVDAGDIGNAHWCSGTLIDETHVLTAGHCFDPEAPDPSRPNVLMWTTPFRVAGHVQLTHQELAPLMVVVFGHQRDRTTGIELNGQSFAVSGLSEYRRNGLDYAIAELDPASGVSLDVDPDTGVRTPLIALHQRQTAIISAHNPRAHQQIVIIQHPDGMLKQIDVGTVSDFVIEWGEPHFRYLDLDTTGGSSGSGVRDAQGRLVGVHVAGGCEKEGVGNRAVPIEAIEGASPYVLHLARP